MVFITMNKRELALIVVFIALFAMSLVGISTFGYKDESIPVVALEEYLEHEGIIYQRTLSIVSVIDKKLTPTKTHYQGRSLYKENNDRIPDRLLWPLDQDLYTIFVKTKN